jgi:signal transduction histidine kinase
LAKEKMGQIVLFLLRTAVARFKTHYAINMFYRKVYSLLIGCLWFIIPTIFAQDQAIADSLALEYRKATNDSLKLELLTGMSYNETRDLKKGLVYAEELISLSKKLGNSTYLRRGYFLKGTKKRATGELEEALEAYFKSAEIAKATHHLIAEGECYVAVADVYSSANNHPTAKDYYKKAIIILRQSNDSVRLASALINAGDELRKIEKYDSAFVYFNESLVIVNKIDYVSGKGYSLGGLGMVYAGMGKYDLAEKNLVQAIKILEETEDYSPVCDYLISMANVYMHKGAHQAALNSVRRSLQLAEQLNQKEQIANASLKLSELYEKTSNPSEALKYYRKHVTYRDSLNNLETVNKMNDLRRDFEMKQNKAELDLINEQKQNKTRLSLYLAIMLSLAIIMLGILVNNNRNKQKAYKNLALQKQEIDQQKAKAQDALTELQFTQKQLIQSAKMASLGELTAGIAHEIQNPLNFVNNFSEVSVELLNELKEGTVNKLSASEKAGADEIINDLADNLKKISDHGKRADSIVKGMLQHSRTSTGKKEPTDINALADDYLRLSYHGVRAKDKEFNVGIKTDFDNRIGKIEIVPQDIGRVLLNLYNNAFYAVKQKSKEGNGAFKPLVSVTTKKLGSKIELSIKDNGAGIPQKLLDKIFQPFFTTKPAGQGTGLGLSLSYDVIKAYGGEVKVETKEGEFAEFIIHLPISNNNGA